MEKYQNLNEKEIAEMVRVLGASVAYSEELYFALNQE